MMIAAFFHLFFLVAIDPMPACHWTPLPLNRKKFGAFTAAVVSHAPAVPLTNVFVGCCLA